MNVRKIFRVYSVKLSFKRFLMKMFVTQKQLFSNTNFRQNLINTVKNSLSENVFRFCILQNIPTILNHVCYKILFFINKILIHHLKPSEIVCIPRKN